MNRRFLEQLKRATKHIKDSVNNPTAQKHMETLKRQKQYAEEQMRQLKKQMKSMQSRFKILQKERNVDPVFKDTGKSQSQKKFKEEAKAEEWGDSLKKGWKEGVESLKNSSKKVQDKVNQLKDSIKPPDFSEHLSQAEKFAKAQKERLQEFGEKGKDRLMEEAQRLQKLKSESTQKLSELAEGVSKGVKKKADFANQLLKKMFWRTTLLIVLACFAYGIGSNLPRQLRLHFSSQQGEEKQKPRSFRKDDVEPNHKA